jgi:hypothetical protein
LEAGDIVTIDAEWGDFAVVDGLEIGFGQMLTEDGSTEALLLRFRLEGHELPLVVCDDDNIKDVLKYLAELGQAYLDWCERRDTVRTDRYQQQVTEVIDEAAKLLEEN